MNHKLLEMLNEAGFDFTPDMMAKLPAFENLVWLEREACAKVCDESANEAPNSWQFRMGANHCAESIRARGQHGN